MIGPDRRQVWAWGSGLAVFVPVSFLLVSEFLVPGNWAWNLLLVLMIVGFAVSAFFIHRYLEAHRDQVGEARFDTSNRHGRS